MRETTADRGVNTLHLELVGGIAGDMFIAACCDLDSSLRQLCVAALHGIAELPPGVRIDWPSAGDEPGARFRVIDDNASSDDHSHMPYRDVRRIVDASDLSDAVRQRVEDLFSRLARSEAHVHGVAPDDVVFHEVGGWDSIIDVVLSATVIDTFGDCRWTAGSIPIGRGTVRCAHGETPLPAPATAELLKGFNVHQDEHTGERVTPTGAAILSHLQPRQLPRLPAGRLLGIGSGYGNRSFDGLPNVLRCYQVAEHTAVDEGDVAVIEFDVDDQTPEDLALGIESLRNLDGVLDVVQTPFVGKKGRLGATVRVLAVWNSLEQVSTACLSATSTLGVRWYRANRRTLARHLETAQVGGRKLQVKHARRPDGRVTQKIEADDLAGIGSSFGEREAVRTAVSRAGDDDAQR